MSHARFHLDCASRPFSCSPKKIQASPLNHDGPLAGASDAKVVRRVEDGTDPTLQCDVMIAIHPVRAKDAESLASLSSFDSDADV